MLPARLVERFYLQLDRERMDTLLELRSLIASVEPDAKEELHRSWITYHHKMDGTPNAGMCIIHIDPRGLRLAFFYGALLPDPKNLLHGTSQYKRYVPIGHYEDTPWDDLRDLITASARISPRSRYEDNRPPELE